ncbi:hypothetical protein Sgly_3155 [Syntrophobotulus glycolicus DSM 8271]|uniref:Uncharacterized protein n=1 Tax=Syntrophobotulus glycolicus (strain DSM 8271 / FlGlyR) TaxID=645991 RepID=F0SX52_SYNGF|nr:hypothetical protein [Syntrophobotulus glycolicus]ADY54890.1 hypothetical protein Sgly_0525 [Syntrophobotulus glycolicus DSM 8271]ADY56912.1 hypothetical protein Sgly_2633 [Syntrophobotulus glycolicus DSM 8271]ADY57249.1 hypothetical protein Sgly_2980 [Syntrophobotulus glycolicus DSM 8271]ADY57421.1 hypothetical protein Sgly_3155 [Syntrophobotulus glycolicus DSM 8271]
MRSTAALKIDEAVTVGLTCLEQGLDSKATVKQNILTAVSMNCLPIREAQSVEELPVEVFELFHRQLGLGFEVRAGKVVGVSFTTPEGKLATVTLSDIERGEK